MKKIIIIVCIVIFSTIFFFNKENCSVTRLFQSSKDFGTFYSFSFCKNFFLTSLKKNIKEILINSPFETTLRSYLKSGNYETISKKKLKKLELIKRENNTPENIKGDINYSEKLKFKNTNLNKVKFNENKTWTRSHGGNNNQKFYDSSEINTKNINRLELLWSYKEKADAFNSVQLNPVYKNNTLYFASGNGKIIAINTISGEKKWSLQSVKNISSRGMVIDEDEEKEIHLYLPLDEKIFKINAKNGKLDKKFGINGGIVLNSRTAPIIINDKICAAQLAPAYIKCYEKYTGNFLFEINVHPKNKDFSLGGTIWGGIAFDKEREIIYVTTGNPRPALIGISRKGSNRNSNSVVAISLKTKKILWSHQDVIHDLWDYDFSAPPILIDLKFDEFIYPAVVVISKVGNVYVFNRETGSSYFNIEYKSTLESKIPGEINSLYQPNIVLPKPLQNLNLNITQLNNKSLDDFKEKIELGFFHFGEFHPPKIGEVVVSNGLHGGVTWPGFSINPLKNIIYAPVNHIPYKYKLELKTYSKIILDDEKYNLYLNKCSSCHGKYRNGNFEYKYTFNPQEMDSDQNYIPSLIGHSIFKDNFNKIFDSKYINKLHKKQIINKDEELKLKLLFKDWDKLILERSEMFYKYNWSQFNNSNDLPATNPPWGEIVAINILNGQEVWKKPIGKIQNNLVGTKINGGVAINSGDILVASGTNDNLIYFLDQNNGNILKTFKMESRGTAPPIIYKDKQSEKITIISGGNDGKNLSENSPTKIYTFGLKK